MEINLQREFAQKDGQEMAAEYDYHLANVENPLPYGIFKTKYNLLKQIEAEAEKAGENDNFQTLPQQMELCRQLGY